MTLPPQLERLASPLLERFLKKDKNRQSVLEFLYSASKSSKMFFQGSKTEAFRYLLYEFLMDCYVHGECDRTAVLHQWKRKEFLWDHPNLTEVIQRFKEQDDFITKPMEIEEGVIECTRCHSKKTFSYTKQTRRADESATVFARCSQCNLSFVL